MNAYRSTGARQNSAYDTIQAKIKAASEANKKGRKAGAGDSDEENPASSSPFDKIDEKETVHLF